MREKGPSRRTFIQSAVALTAGAAAAESATAADAAAPPAPSAGIPSGSGTGAVPRRKLGRTGVEVSCIGLGGWHVVGGVRNTETSIRIMHTAIDRGVTFFDNAWEYNDGQSEEVMGKALAMDGKRQKVFLMTKVCERDQAGCAKQIDESLRRLRTDHIDLLQFHELTYDNDPAWIFERGGLKAALAAQKAGKIRFLGFTGHKDPRIHLDMLGKPFAWDTAQMPTNVFDGQFRSFAGQVIPVCQKQGVGVIGMKSMGGGLPPPFVTKVGLTAEACVRYALGLPIATVVVGLTSLEQLEQAAAFAARGPLPDDERRALVARIAGVAGDGRFEVYKTGRNFDGAFHRQQHGFEG